MEQSLTPEQIKEFKKMTPVLIGGGLLLVLMGAQLLSILTLGILRDNTILEPATVGGTIVEKRVMLSSTYEDPNCMITFCFVDYEFQIEAGTFAKRQRVDAVFWDEVTTGTEVMIRYDLSDPTRSTLITGTQSLMPLCGGLAILGGLLMALSGLSLRRQTGDNSTPMPSLHPDDV